MRISLSYLQNLKKCFNIENFNEIPKYVNYREDIGLNYCKIYFLDIVNFPLTLTNSHFKTYLKNFFSVNEIRIFTNFKKKYRKYEWFIGRLLAKIAIIECLEQLNLRIPNLNQIEIITNSYGKPGFRIINHDNKLIANLNNYIYFSIAHKSSNVLAAISINYPIGIDIEKIRNFSNLLNRKIICTSEMDEVTLFLKTKKITNNENYVKTAVWCIKEATSKAIGLGLKVNFKNLEIKLSDGELFCIYYENGKEEWYKANMFKKGEYLIALIKKEN